MIFNKHINIKAIQENDNLPAIVSGSTCESIYSKCNTDSSINAYFGSPKNINFDMDGISYISTKCAKDIFGKLYVELGPEKYETIVHIDKATPEVTEAKEKGIISAIS